MMLRFHGNDDSVVIQTHNIMDSPIVFPLADLPMPTRSPLSNRSNIHITSWEHKDSSEGQPSPHDSVYDAAYLSTSDFAKSPYQSAIRPATPLTRPIDIDLDSESPLSLLETPFLYGYGTELGPIMEQRSIATLRTRRSMSTSDLSSLMHDAPGAGSSSQVDSGTAPPLRQLRRQHSFSLDDLPSTTRLKRQAVESDPQLRCLAYARSTVHVAKIHAYPRKPIYPPPQRLATPTSLANLRGTGRYEEPYAGSSGATMYEVPDFRPPRSGHGNLSAHPFMRQNNTASGAEPPPSGRSSWWEVRRYGQASSRAALGARPGVQASTCHDLGTPDIRHLSPPGVRGGACKNCRHPRGEWWSLGSTVIGHGPGMRRGADWCSRCACRKIARIWCCRGEVTH
ncbi:hypothetical protein F5Y19DRAFT_467702 [Xylariaceae sp. FL1651]|nr:hypothetical protein F5Y19DRAFT_467702 [Xylariaceae sp. FL1651]